MTKLRPDVGVTSVFGLASRSACASDGVFAPARLTRTDFAWDRPPPAKGCLRHWPAGEVLTGDCLTGLRCLFAGALGEGTYPVALRSLRARHLSPPGMRATPRAPSSTARRSRRPGGLRSLRHGPGPRPASVRGAILRAAHQWRPTGNLPSGKAGPPCSLRSSFALRRIPSLSSGPIVSSRASWASMRGTPASSSRCRSRKSQ